LDNDSLFFWLLVFFSTTAGSKLGNSFYFYFLAFLYFVHGASHHWTGPKFDWKTKKRKKNNPFYPPVYSSSVMNFVIGTHVLALAFWVMLRVHIWSVGRRAGFAFGLEEGGGWRVYSIQEALWLQCRYVYVVSPVGKTPTRSSFAIRQGFIDVIR